MKNDFLNNLTVEQLDKCLYDIIYIMVDTDDKRMLERWMIAYEDIFDVQQLKKVSNDNKPKPKPADLPNEEEVTWP